MRIMTLAEVCEINPRKAINLPAESEISFIPMEAVSVCGEIDTSRSIPVEKVKNYTVFCEGDILFAKITPCMENGKGAIAVGLKNGWGAGSTEFIVLRPNVGIVLPQWIYLFLSQKSFRLNCQQNMTGSAGQKRVPAKYLAKCKIPVPPITEQEQILSRSEELFSQLDKGVETLQKTKQQLAVYRQAVISSAFPKVDQTEWKRLDEIAEIIGGITKGRNLEGKETIELPYLRVANVQNGYLDLSEIKTIVLKKTEKEKYLLEYGDVLYTEGGDRDKLGRGTIWKNEIEECVHQNHVFKARLDKTQTLPEYVAYWSMSTFARNYFYEKGKQSVNLASINKSVLSALTLPVPSLVEQGQVVTDIKERLSVCESIENTIDLALQQADAMRQSVLKQAFEGR